MDSATMHLLTQVLHHGCMDTWSQGVSALCAICGWLGNNMGWPGLFTGGGTGMFNFGGDDGGPSGGDPGYHWSPQQPYPTEAQRQAAKKMVEDRRATPPWM